jgi:ribosome biogenesis protein ENP2
MFSMVRGSGLILAALEDPKIGCYFIPELGPAPRWIPYLENMTE